MTNLSGKVAVITGSARGIGKGIAQRYVSLGAAVVINYVKDGASADSTVAEITQTGGRAIAVQADTSVIADLDRLFETARAEFGSIDIVVANAGVEVIDTSILDTTEEEFDRLNRINTRGAFFTLQKAAQALDDGGRLINIGSSSTVGPYPGTGAYAASKLSAQHVIGVLAIELGPRNITANNIIPTVISGAGVFTDVAGDQAFQDMNTSIRPLGGRAGTPADVADAAEFFAGELSGWISGQSLLVSGGAPY